jgi:hypothetical protein
MVVKKYDERNEIVLMVMYYIFIMVNDMVVFVVTHAHFYLNVGGKFYVGYYKSVVINLILLPPTICIYLVVGNPEQYIIQHMVIMLLIRICEMFVLFSLVFFKMSENELVNNNNNNNVV